MAKAPLRRAVFLDRDGTINKMVYYPDHGIMDSPFLPSQMELLPGAASALAALKKKGFLLVVVSNQPGVAKGNLPEKTFKSIDRKFDSLLKRNGVALDAKYFCFHHPHATVARFRARCPCRKPKPGMIKKAAKDLGIDLQRSFMAGDGVVDVQAGRAAGCKTVFIGMFKPELWKFYGNIKKPDFVAKSLLHASKKIR